MTTISDERAAELLKLCDEREKPLIVGCGMAVVFTADLRALLAAREREQRITLTVNRLHDWLSRNVPSEMRNGDCVDIAIRLLGERAAVQADLIAARDALAKLVRRCRESPQLEPLLHDRVSDSLCHASCPLCSARQALTGDEPNG